MGGWSDLPSDILLCIARNLPHFTDHLRVRSVCSHWRSSLPSSSSSSSPPHSLPPQLPWLALPSARFYSLAEDRVYSTPPPAVPDTSLLFGSSSGWLLSLSPAASLIVNPFTGALIELPSPDPTSSLSYAASDTLAWDRSGSFVLAACTTGDGVFYCRLGDAQAAASSSWTPIESQRHAMVSSITFYEGRFYVLRADTCETAILDGESLEPVALVGAPAPDTGSSVEAHLLVSSGELLLLLKSTWMYLFPDSDSQFYKVRRRSLDDEFAEWVEVNDIGDRALFVDNLRCFSVQAGDDDSSLLRRNCVYSAQSRTSGHRSRNLSTMCSVSVFDLGSSSCERFECALSRFRAASASLPSWILPSLS